MFTYSDLSKSNYSTGDIAKLLGVTPQTVWHYTNAGSLSGWYTDGGHLRVPKEELIRFLSDRGLFQETCTRYDIIYARVSSHEQKVSGDLDRQIADLVRGVPQLDKPEIITDVASGLNDSRVGLQKVMSKVSNGEVSRVVIYSKDRLTRFGFNYLEFFFNKNGTEIVCLDNSTTKNSMQELVDDMMNLIASFSGKFYGIRSAKKRAARKVIDEVESDD